MDKRLTAAVLSSALAAGACSTSGHAGLPAASPGAAATARAPAYTISARGTKGHPVTISNIVSGRLEYQLRAASVVYATNLQQATFKSNTLFFYKGRKMRLTVTAPTAVVDETSHDVALSGGVLARTGLGDTLASDTMQYNEKTRLLTAVGHVTAGDPSGNKLTGERAIADLDLQQIQLFGESGTAQPQPQRGATP